MKWQHHETRTPWNEIILQLQARFYAEVDELAMKWNLISPFRFIPFSARCTIRDCAVYMCLLLNIQYANLTQVIWDLH